MITSRLSLQSAQSSGEQKSLPPTSLVICSRNRPKLLLETVESVLQGQEVPTELIIIDQSDVSHPTLETFTTNRPCEVRYLWTCSVGVGRARNAGITAAQYEILAFTDDDMSATPAWFGSLVRALLEAGRRAVVTGQVLPGDMEVPGSFVPSTKSHEALVVYEGRVGKDVLWTGNMALYRSAVETVGFFDERLGPGSRFPASEDNDFGFRLLEAGYHIVYMPEAILYHRAWRSKHDYLPLRWNYGRGQGAYYAKYLSLRDHYILRRMCWHMLSSMFRFVRRLPCQRRLAYGDAVFVLGMLSGAVQWLLTQRRPR